MTEPETSARNPFALPLRDYDVNPYIHPVEARSGKGGRLVSAAGREYVDFMSAWGTNLLGYGHRRVGRAVSKQIRRFASLGLPYPEFHELAELIQEIVPSAEVVRYGKNGSDACSGAVRLARAITGRDHVLYRGYHGFHDWYMASTDCAGIPAVLKTQIDSLEDLAPEAVDNLLGRSPVKVAAVMINPLVGPYPSADGVREVIEVVHSHGALMIFDEMMSGFRVANGGMQEVWGVEPDLSCFGKSIANGLPLSALVGKREYMAQLPDTYYGMTFEGEAVSIAAAHATLKELIERQVVAALYAKGKRLRSTFDELSRRYEVAGRLVGYEPCMHMEFDDHGPVGGRELLWLMLQELERHGVFTLGAFILSYSHGRRDLNRLFAAFESSLVTLRQAVERGTTEELLDERIRRSLGSIRGPGQWRKQTTASAGVQSSPQPTEAPIDAASTRELKTWWDCVASSLEEAKSTSYAPDPVQLRLSGEHGDDNSPGARQLAEFAEVDSSSRVLEVGSGVGRIGRSFAPRVREWVGADISARLIHFAREYTAEHDNVRFHETDGVSLEGLESASFDFVYSTVVLAYMDKEDLFANLRASCRVLKPGHRAYFDTWNQLHPDTFRLWLASQRHNRGDGKDLGRLRCSSGAEFRHLLERAGFEILAFDEERLLRAWCRKPDVPDQPGTDGVAPFGYVDCPSSGQDFVGPFTISGWALDDIERVDVFIDGVAPSASAQYGLERNDLVALFPDYAEAGRAGFALRMDPGTLVPGRHEIEVLATDTQRRTTRLTGYHRSFSYRPSE